MWWPKTFFRRSLKFGSKVVGIVMCIVTMICLIVATVQVAMMAEAKWSLKEFIGRNAYGITIVQLVYCIFMLGVCLWFFWGVQMEKSNVVLSWLVIYAMWLSEVCCLLFVLVCLYSFDVDVVSFVFCFIFGLITICCLVYGLVIVLAYWYELKDKKREARRLDPSETQPSQQTENK